MRHLDALGEIPEELIGVYDVVQLRLFQVVVKDNDPGPLLRNAVSMLSGIPIFLMLLLLLLLLLFLLPSDTIITVIIIYPQQQHIGLCYPRKPHLFLTSTGL